MATGQDLSSSKIIHRKVANRKATRADVSKSSVSQVWASRSSAIRVHNLIATVTAKAGKSATRKPVVLRSPRAIVSANVETR
jgi:hypothetical protein